MSDKDVVSLVVRQIVVGHKPSKQCQRPDHDDFDDAGLNHRAQGLCGNRLTTINRLTTMERGTKSLSHLFITRSRTHAIAAMTRRGVIGDSLTSEPITKRASRTALAIAASEATASSSKFPVRAKAGEDHAAN